MQKAQIKAGVLYGYVEGTSEYRTAAAAIVLDVKGLWTWDRPNRGANYNYQPSRETRYTTASGGWSAYSGPHGYLILKGSNYRDQEKQVQHLAELKALYAEFAATARSSYDVNELAAKVRQTEGVTLLIANNRWITGDYLETKNEEDEREAARQAKHKAERERAAAETAFMAEASEIISAKLERTVNLTRDYSYDGKRASLTFNDLAAFLGIKTPTERL